MNKFSLTFQSPHQENKFCHEKFQLEKFIIEKLRAIILITSILIVVNNFIYGNYIFAVLYFVLGCFAQLSFKLILLRPTYLDYFILALQLLLHSLYPFLIFLDIKFGQVSHPNMAKQYIRASMIQMFSCSMMVGSKYYFKALVFIYETTLQVALYYISYPHYQYPENLYLVLAGFCAVYSTYNIELAQRRYYISKEQSITFNQNILNDFPQSWVSCYYRKGLIYLGEFNKSIRTDFNIKDNASFISFCKNVKTASKDSLFNQLAKLMISKENFQSPIQISGQLDQQKISCNVSRYLNEDKQMLLITLTNNRKEKLLKHLQKRCELFQKMLTQLQYSVKECFESNSIYQDSYSIYRYQINFHTILCMFSSFEKKQQSNQSEIIYEALKQNIDRINDKCLKIYYKVDGQQFNVMKYHFYLLINNLIIQAIDNSEKRCCIKISLDVSTQSLLSPVFRFRISYRGRQIEDQLLKNLNQLCKRICVANRLEFKLDSIQNCQYFAYFSK